MLVIRGNDDGQPKWGQLARRVRKHASTHTETAGEDFKARILRTSPCASNYPRKEGRCQVRVNSLGTDRDYLFDGFCFCPSVLSGLMKIVEMHKILIIYELR